MRLRLFAGVLAALSISVGVANAVATNRDDETDRSEIVLLDDEVQAGCPTKHPTNKSYPRNTMVTYDVSALPMQMTYENEGQTIVARDAAGNVVNPRAIARSVMQVFNDRGFDNQMARRSLSLGTLFRLE